MFYNCAVQVASEYGLGDHVQTSYNGSTYNIVHENNWFDGGCWTQLNARGFWRG